jgi:hypothetical protein
MQARCDRRKRESRGRKTVPTFVVDRRNCHTRVADVRYSPAREHVVCTAPRRRTLVVGTSGRWVDWAGGKVSDRYAVIESVTPAGDGTVRLGLLLLGAVGQQEARERKREAAGLERGEW